MLDSNYPERVLRTRYPKLADAAASDAEISLELGMLLAFAPAVDRARRTELDVPGVLKDASGRTFPVRLSDLSVTGAQIAVRRDEPVLLFDLLDATFEGPANADGIDMTLHVQLVRVVYQDDTHVFLGFRFRGLGAHTEGV